ncbi:DNA/RNA non-specific endonuclease [Nocardiopsis xinjiangensis]|uniref:hypothetical protein n=1 Tax=Nocardiopsis xinjiangensis TaxID=124285 RepID=UPI001267BBB1|nr:hypothetical protein [Nocardiopsis xinjiangensis]
MPGPTERFGDGADLEPNRTYEITDSEGRSSTYFTDSGGKITEIHTDARTRGADHPELLNPHKDAKYVVRTGGTEYTYYTDSNGRTVRAEGELDYGKHDRNKDAQDKIGQWADEYFTELNHQIIEDFKADHGRNPNPGEVELWKTGSKTWNGGHLYASGKLHGPGEHLNQVAMLTEVNQHRVANGGITGNYRNAERTWEALLEGKEHLLRGILKQDYDEVMSTLGPALESGPRPPKIETSIRMTDDPNLEPITLKDGTVRYPPPSDIRVDWKVNGVPQKKLHYENLPIQ